MTATTMPYLVAAFMAVWIILALYLFSLHARQKKLREELRLLKERLEKDQAP
ncbi:MAG TPA: CcmD family protein [Acidobacteriota bacterium]|nr:CcmD family protein [Acidobacteriota bacterium]